MNSQWTVAFVAGCLLAVAGLPGLMHPPGPTGTAITSDLRSIVLGPSSTSGGHEGPAFARAANPDLSPVTLVPPAGGAPEICANGTPSNPFPVSFLPYGYITPNLFGLGSGSSGLDDLCYTGGADGVVSNVVNFSSVGGAEGVDGFPHIEYGQDLWGGSPGNMSPNLVLPETVSNATNSSLWLTNSYSVNDSEGGAAFDYVWDNFLSTYVPNPNNTSGPGNFSLEIMLWMSTGLEGSPFTYFPYEGTASLPTLVNASLSDQPWDFSHFCQGGPDNNSELTVLYFYNGTGDAMNASSRTMGVNFSAVLLNVNQMIRSADVTCWGYADNSDAQMYLDDLNLGTEFLTPFPSPYYGEAFFHWTVSSMCFTFPEGPPTANSVSCPSSPGQPLNATISANPSSGVAPLSVNFSVNPTGGVPPYAFNWSFGDGTHASGPAPTHEYSLPGGYAVRVMVNDSNGSSIQRTLTVDVSPPPLEVRLTASATAGFAPLAVQFSSAISGGVPPYSYRWTSGGNTLGTGASLSHSFDAPGQYSVTLSVNDSSPSPQTNRTSITIDVAAGSSGSGGPPLTGDDLYFLAGGIAVLAGGLLLAMRRRQRELPSPPSEPPPPRT